MKNSIFLMAMGLILLSGCSKDESNEQITQQFVDSVYVSKQIDGNTIWKTMSRDELPNESVDTHLRFNGNAHTSGYFSLPSREVINITWTGTQNDNRFLGSAELEQSAPGYSFHFIMETECVTVDGNEAVYGGIITEVIQTSGNPPPIGVDWRFYFKVIDGGRGGNTGFDFISNTRIFASPRSTSLCNIKPSDPVWSSHGYQQVIEPGYVNVSH
jgi:hypothetical protein